MGLLQVEVETHKADRAEESAHADNRKGVRVENEKMKDAEEAGKLQEEEKEEDEEQVVGRLARLAGENTKGNPPKQGWFVCVVSHCHFMSCLYHSRSLVACMSHIHAMHPIIPLSCLLIRPYHSLLSFPVFFTLSVHRSQRRLLLSLYFLSVPCSHSCLSLVSFLASLFLSPSRLLLERATPLARSSRNV